MTTQAEEGQSFVNGSASSSSNNSSNNNNNNQLENIKVAVRLRPFTEKERQRNNRRIVDIEQNTVVLYNPSYGDVNLKKFTFDYSYWSHDGFKKDPNGVNVADPDHSNSSKYVGQERVFDDLGKFLLKNTLEGYNSALLAYGPTGSGKSYTVSGYGQNEGILPRFARALFAQLEAKKLKNPNEEPNEIKTSNEENHDEANNRKKDKREEDETNANRSSTDSGSESGNNRYEIYFSMIEIYNEVVRDLLAKGGQNGAEFGGQTIFGRRGLKVREHPKHGFFVENLTSYSCLNQSEIENLIVEGQLNKSIAATSMNETSSRGHTIYEFTIKQYKLKSAKSQEEILTTSMVQLVDLAGSERMAVHVTNQFDLINPNSGPSNIPVSTNSTTNPANSSNSRSNSPFPGAGAGSLRTKSSTARVSTNSATRATNASVSQSGSNNGGSSSTATSGSGLTSGSSLKRSGLNTQSVANSSNYQKRFKESISINQSLSALGNCIQVMSHYSQQLDSGTTSNASKKPMPKIPYRDSALTKLLNRCCLSGNSKVVIIATLSPVDTNYDDTLSTLRFADRAKRIRTHATINRMSRGGKVERGSASGAVEELQRENERLKMMVDGRVTRSDDSSQTSNFDDTENVAENFTGSKINPAAKSQQQNNNSKLPIATSGTQKSSLEAIAGSSSTQNRSRTTFRKNANGRRGTNLQERASADRAISPASSSSLLTVKQQQQEQIKGLVSPASRKQLTADISTSESEINNQADRSGMQKSSSMANGLEYRSQRYEPLGMDPFDDVELNELADINESGGSLMSADDSDEEDSFAALADNQQMSNDEKIELFNRLLNNSKVANSRLQQAKESATASPIKSMQNRRRPKKASSRQRNKIAGNENAGENAGNSIMQVSVLSSSLKKSNPFLSNLNPDEQLTGVISYMIKEGETVIGKNSNECDVVLHGPELRAKHAKIIRVQTQNQAKNGQVCGDEVYIEPILPDGDEGELASRVALKLNGSPVINRTRLHHCDRLLFGTNAYFVFSNNLENENNSGAGTTLASLDMVTYDMACNEVMRKVMSEATNEAVIREIKDYTHRPGTGKHRVSSTAKDSVDMPDNDNNKQIDSAMFSQTSKPKLGSSKLLRSITIHDHDQPIARLEEEPIESSEKANLTSGNVRQGEETDGPPSDISKQETNYRDQLLEDTYEYAMPVAEVNAVAKEFGVKVTYGLKILTGEEQLLELAPTNYQLFDYSVSDGFSSSSAGAASRGQSEGLDNNTYSNERSKQDLTQGVNDDRVTRLTRIDYLDIPPALFIKVHFEETGFEFYWSKEKFQARRYKILELYGLWDVGGKSALVEHLIDQSKIEGYYLIDPFIDDPITSFVLIGHAQITLQPLSHLADMIDSYDIIDVNDELVGSITIQAIPCHSEELPVVSDNNNSTIYPQSPFKPYTEEELSKNLLQNPKELLNKKLVIVLKIISCTNLPDKYGNIFCLYSLNPDQPSVRTKMLRTENYDNYGEGGFGELVTQNDTEPQASASDNNSTPDVALQDSEITRGNLNESDESESKNVLEFDHEHFIIFDNINQDILDFFEHGFLTIQVVGQYHLNEETIGSRQPSVVSTIITSINKYKSKMEQQQQNNSFNNNYSYYNTSSSSKSHRNTSSGMMNSNSGASSVVSTSATVNLFDQQNDDDDQGSNSMNGISQENMIDMILTKRKLDRAENQLHYLKRTVNIAEHYNKKHIPVKTVKKLLNSYVHELDSGSLEDMAAQGKLISAET